MSALPDQLPRFRRMTPEDLDAVEAIEQAVYTHPWSRGNFADSLAAGYHCRVMTRAGDIVGYAVIMMAADEAHLLNLSIAAAVQRQGLGGTLLDYMRKLAKDHAAQTLFLEVRASNAAARALYARHGFREIGIRRAYYPADQGREDAVTMACTLS